MLKQIAFRKRVPRAASHEELAAIEAEIGVTLPPAFFEFCSRWNGGFLGNENQFYPVPRCFGDFFEEYGTGTAGVLVTRLVGVTEEFQQCSFLRAYHVINYGLKVGIIPIAADQMGDQVVLRADDPGGLVYWRDPDLWETPENPPPGPQFPDRPRLIPIAKDLEFFYNSLTRDPDATW